MARLQLSVSDGGLYCITKYGGENNLPKRFGTWLPLFDFDLSIHDNPVLGTVSYTVLREIKEFGRHIVRENFSMEMLTVDLGKRLEPLPDRVMMRAA